MQSGSITPQPTAGAGCRPSAGESVGSCPKRYIALGRPDPAAERSESVGCPGSSMNRDEGINNESPGVVVLNAITIGCHSEAGPDTSEPHAVDSPSRNS